MLGTHVLAITSRHRWRTFCWRLGIATLTFASPLALRAETASTPETGKPETDYSHIQRPLWELGVGGTVNYGPDYPASNEYHVNGFGAPIFIYRGDFFRLGEDSIAEAIAVDTSRFKLDLSFDASFKADSDDNNARKGMSDLDYLGEVGPQVVFHALRWVSPEDGATLVDLQLPVRAVFSTDFKSVENRGFVVQPGVGYKRRFAGESPWRLRASLSSIWANEELMDYFYEVRSKDVRPNRPEYDAKAGYLGSELRLGVSKEIVDNLTVYLSSRTGLYAGARNDNSPLFKSDFGGSVSLSFVWSFWRSEDNVSVEW